MQSSSASRAWPHFVPRLELDVELKAIGERITDTCKRLDKAEAHGTKLRSRLDEQSSDQSDEVTKRLAEMEERVSHEVAALRLELQRGLEDVRANTAAEAAVRERMLTSHESLFKDLTGDVAALRRQTTHLDLEVQDFPVKYATKALVSGVQQKSLNDSADMFRELKEELARLEASKPGHQAVRELHDAVHSKHEDLQLTSTLASSSLDGMKKHMALLENRQGAVERNKTAIDSLAVTVAGLGRQMRTAREEQKLLRSQVSQEHEALRRTVYAFQDSARELRESMELLGFLDTARLELLQRCEQTEKDVASLAVREMSHWEASQDASHARKQEHGALEALHNSLKQELGKHVEAVKDKTEKLRQHNVSLCFEQMDKAIGIQKSLMEMERGQRDLQEAVKGVHLPRV